MTIEMLQEKLLRWQRKMPETLKIALEKAVKVVKEQEQRNLGGLIVRKRSGKLSRSVMTEVIVSLTEIRARTYIDPKQVYKAVTLEFGKTIRPKKANALRFKIGNQWVTVKSVRIPQKEWKKVTIEQTRAEVGQIILGDLMMSYRHG